MPNPTESELAYIAGILDGEGHIGIHHYKQRDGTPGLRLIVDIANTHLPLILWIQERLGGDLSVDNRIEGRKPVYHLRFGSSLAGTILEVVLPFLIVKKSVARLCIEFRTLIGRRGTGVQREDLRTKVKVLNSRGG